MSAFVSQASRYRSDLVTIFDVFCEIGSLDPTSIPIILTKYPEDYNDEAVLKSTCQFSFPCSSANADPEAVQLFCFVLTDSNSKYTYGYCRFTPRTNTCICLISGLPWPSVFYKLLNTISNIMNNGKQADLDRFLTTVYHSDIPSPGENLVFDCSPINKLELKVPDMTKLPTLSEDKFMLEFFSAVSPKQMMALYASILKERRIIFTGRRLSQLSSCICASSTLLFPMIWQGIFIPVLPDHLADMMMAPMPFLIGVPKPVFEKHNRKDLGDVVIVDLDDKSLQSAHDDVALLPTSVVSFLRSSLKSTGDMGDYISRTFLRANVLLFGGYRLGFKRRESTGEIYWDKQQFITEQKPFRQTFLSSLVGVDGVQYLERFMHDRLQALNCGQSIDDEFEREIVAMEGKMKSQNISQDTLQMAVQSVKDNASDVIGVLKEKVTGIQIGSKLTKLTPKEIRRNKNWSTKKSTKQNGIEPLSFSNAQWHDLEPETDEAVEAFACSSSSSAAVPVANLIDLDSPVSCSSAPSGATTNPFLDLLASPSSFYTSQSISSNDLLNKPRLPNVPPIPTNPFVDPFISPEKPTPPPRNWEKFD